MKKLAAFIPFVCFLSAIGLSYAPLSRVALQNKDCHHRGPNRPGAEIFTINIDGIPDNNPGNGLWHQTFEKGNFKKMSFIKKDTDSSMAMGAAANDVLGPTFDVSGYQDNSAKLGWSLRDPHETQPCCHGVKAQSEFHVNLGFDFDVKVGPQQRRIDVPASGLVEFGTASQPEVTSTTFVADNCGVTAYNHTKTVTIVFSVRFTKGAGQVGRLFYEGASTSTTESGSDVPPGTLPQPGVPGLDQPDDVGRHSAQITVPVSFNKGAQYKASCSLEVLHKGKVKSEADLNVKVAGSLEFEKKKLDLEDLNNCEGGHNRNPAKF